MELGEGRESRPRGIRGRHWGVPRAPENPRSTPEHVGLYPRPTEVLSGVRDGLPQPGSREETRGPAGSSGSQNRRVPCELRAKSLDPDQEGFRGEPGGRRRGGGTGGEQEPPLPSRVLQRGVRRGVVKGLLFASMQIVLADPARPCAPEIRTGKQSD